MKLLGLLAAVIALGVLVGCSSSGYEPSVKTTSSLDQAAKSIDRTNDQVDAAIRTLNAILMTPGDMSMAFKDYNNAVSDLESTYRDVNNKVIAMREQGNAFFSQWDKDAATLRNEDVRARSEQRKAEVQAQFNKMQSDYQKLQRTFTPFMNDLRDIRTSLAYNNSTSGVMAIQPLATKAKADAGPVHESLNALSADFRQLGVAVATTMPTTAPAPAPSAAQ